jgi:hypothetical protein
MFPQHRTIGVGKLIGYSCGQAEVCNDDYPVIGREERSKTHILLSLYVGTHTGAKENISLILTSI